MIEELPDDIEQDELDDIEPVGDENQLYDHLLRAIAYRKRLKTVLSWPMVNR